ncbi:MAG: signal peptidase I [SAR202 cluster bacterium Io17-Chloro-G4]|nr:MAG: signal peptidase I [SAR202 cluster bacterium Io17-Chloro-G4]
MGMIIRFVQRLINLFTSARFVVKGNSMLPTLGDGESVVAVRSRSSWNRLVRGDIVVFRHLEFPDRVFIKRIVGFPDEQVRVENGAVYIDDVFLEEPYLDGQEGGRQDLNRTWWNGRGELFLVGDNRQDSQDSRTFGPVDGGMILGRVWLRCWPLGAWEMEPGRG